jgi:hypothetical protein
MIDFPWARPEMVTARMVCDLLVGIRTFPRSADCSLIIRRDFFSILFYFMHDGFCQITLECRLTPGPAGP